MKNKNMKTKILAFLLASLILFSIFGSFVLGEGQEEEGKEVPNCEGICKDNCSEGEAPLVGGICEGGNLCCQTKGPSAGDVVSNIVGFLNFVFGIGKPNIASSIPSLVYTVMALWPGGMALSPIGTFFTLTGIGLQALKLSMVFSGHLGVANPEEKLGGWDSCKLCNWDNYTICTEERCNILGRCKFVPYENREGGMCLPMPCQGAPEIEKMEVSFLVDHKDLWQKKFEGKQYDFQGIPAIKLTPDEDGVLENVYYAVDAAKIKLEIKPVEGAGADCRYAIDNDNVSFEEMTPFDNAYAYPITTETLIDLSDDKFERGSETIPEKGWHTIYIRCKSTCNETTGSENYIKFHYEPIPERLPPKIIDVYPNPMEGGYLSSEARYASINFTLNENGWCSYSTPHPKQNLTKKWEGEDPDLKSCFEDPNQVNAYAMCLCDVGDNQGKNCKTIKDNDPNAPDDQWFVQKEGSRCYFNQKCPDGRNDCTVCSFNISLADKYAYVVWNFSKARSIIEACESGQNLPECQQLREIEQQQGVDMGQLIQQQQEGTLKMYALNVRCQDDSGNRMKEEDTYEYRIMTYPPYNMTIVKPEDGMITYEKEIYMEVNTSRSTVCKYSVDESKAFDEMGYIEGTEVMDTNHTGFTPALTNGQHTLYVKCRDIGGLQKEGSVNFYIKKADPPKVIRMWADGTDLRIETDIKAECVYSIDENKKCNYNALEASNFSTLDNYIHLAPLVMDWTYYVKCRDIWHDNNYPTDCTTIIKPFELPRF